MHWHAVALWVTCLGWVATLQGLGQVVAQDAPVVIVEDFWAKTVIRELVKTVHVERTVGPKLESDYVDLRRFVDGQVQIVALRVYPTTEENTWIYGFRGKEISKTSYLIAQAKVLVVVNSDNALDSISLEQCRLFLGRGGEKADWSAIKGFGGKVTVYGEPLRSISRAVVHGTAMKMVVDGHDRGYLRLGTNWKECADGDEVVKKVKADSDGIGFIQYKGAMPTGVRVLRVAKTATDSAVKPSDGPYIQPDYPLAEPVVLYLHPTEPAAARQFCEFAIGPNGAAIAEKFGLITPCMQKAAEGKARMADVKVGKGPRLSTIGIAPCRTAMQAFGENYVRAKATMQLAYLPVGSDVSALGEFVASVPIVVPATQPGSVPVVTPFVAGGGKELLLLPDRPSEPAMKIHGEKWNALQPAELMLAGRAAAVIVNSANKLDSLTLEQVRAIFSCDVDDWATIGGTGLKAAAGAKGAIPINRFGPLPSDAAAGVFFKECLTQDKVKRVTFKDDAAAVISAVSMDSQAIGFVDLSAIPPTGQTVKALGIRLKTSVGGKDGERVETSYLPTAENIKNAMYPFSQRLYLYVHPKASDTAKDFAKFIATCGGSEATPYADTVKAMMDTYQKNGLIPLADTAIDRAAKDAEAAAAAAKAKEEAAKQPKPKGK